MFYVLPLRTHYVLLSRKSKHKTYVLSKQQGQRAKNHKVLSENYCVMFLSKQEWLKYLIKLIGIPDKSKFILDYILHII